MRPDSTVPTRVPTYREDFSQPGGALHVESFSLLEGPNRELAIAFALHLKSHPQDFAMLRQALSGEGVRPGDGALAITGGGLEEESAAKALVWLLKQMQIASVVRMSMRSGDDVGELRMANVIDAKESNGGS